uniref:NADH dehydrogenase subunit 6 n=1 Tax=Eleutherocaulis alte TaxID=74076 RepID=UPI0023D808CC|nr:NADH dehydrogenase subunit 6 [Eleutherocaulis alte]WDD39310.1 NADH dehydrogenase subunit 6 [Eleutherocaulis alte]
MSEVMTMVIITSSTILMSLLICDVPLKAFLFLLLLGVVLCSSVVTMTNSWCAMLLFLIFIGGLLVLFMYINIVKISFSSLGSSMIFSPFVIVFIICLKELGLFSNLKGNWSSFFFSGSIFSVEVILLLVCILFLVFLVIVDIISPKVGALVIG